MEMLDLRFEMDEAKCVTFSYNSLAAARRRDSLYGNLWLVSWHSILSVAAVLT